MHSKILKDFLQNICKQVKWGICETVGYRVRPTVFDASAAGRSDSVKSKSRVFKLQLDLQVVGALPKAEHFRWKDCLFWSLSPPFGSIKTSVLLLSVCCCLFRCCCSLFTCRILCCNSYFIFHCCSISPTMITRREWQLRTKPHSILILEWLTHFLAGTNL